jgi:hypothetical protein
MFARFVDEKGHAVRIFDKNILIEIWLAPKIGRRRLA